MDMGECKKKRVLTSAEGKAEREREKIAPNRYKFCHHSQATDQRQQLVSLEDQDRLLRIPLCILSSDTEEV
jgi:hypothetical protein